MRSRSICRASGDSARAALTPALSTRDDSAFNPADGLSRPALWFAAAGRSWLGTEGDIAMKWVPILVQLTLASLAAACSGTNSSQAAGAPAPSEPEGLNKVNHVIILMMENHSFDNYFGALAYAPGSPYHTSPVGCAKDDHRCVDGLTCSVAPTGTLTCTNSNPDDQGGPVTAFHDSRRCVIPDLAHAWSQSHQEANYNDPNAALFDSPNDGFVRVNDALYQPDNGVETATEDETMGFYTQDDIPFYYDLAQKFAIDDRYFASVIGPTLPNRL